MFTGGKETERGKTPAKRTEENELLKTEPPAAIWFEERMQHP